MTDCLSPIVRRRFSLDSGKADVFYAENNRVKIRIKQLKVRRITC